jgi:6-pyruvoyltetrahydropterin/6-carboxytetrahydropterin synthase
MMRYRVEKTLEISAAHSLTLPYKSKCTELHGHNWIVTVVCETEKLDESGMVVDFGMIKNIVMSVDHTNLNEQFPEFNPTAENIARRILRDVPFCREVRIQESQGNVAIVSVD